MNCDGYPKMKDYKCMNLPPSTIPWSDTLPNDFTLSLGYSPFKEAGLKLFGLRIPLTFLIIKDLKSFCSDGFYPSMCTVLEIKTEDFKIFYLILQ